MNRHLEVFIKVAELKNFSKAGEELHMSQPAVSQYIKDLEETLGARLLERSNRYVYLNKAGEIVYRFAKEILALYGKMQKSLDDLTQHPRGPLAIGASYTFGEYILPRVIAKLKRNYPLILPSVKIGNTKQIVELVSTHQIDIGIIEGSIYNEKLYTRVIAEDEMVVVASSDYPTVTEKEISITDLADKVWILREEGSGTREAADQLFATYHIEPKQVMEFGSTQLIKESVKEGLGISLLSKWAIAAELKECSMQKIPVKQLPFRRKFSIVTDTLYQTKTIQTFIKTLLDTVKQLNADFLETKN